MLFSIMVVMAKQSCCSSVVNSDNRYWCLIMDATLTNYSINHFGFEHIPSKFQATAWGHTVTLKVNYLIAYIVDQQHSTISD